MLLNTASNCFEHCVQSMAFWTERLGFIKYSVWLVRTRRLVTMSWTLCSATFRTQRSERRSTAFVNSKHAICKQVPNTMPHTAIRNFQTQRQTHSDARRQHLGNAKIERDNKHWKKYQTRAQRLYIERNAKYSKRTRRLYIERNTKQEPKA